MPSLTLHSIHQLSIEFSDNGNGGPVTIRIREKGITKSEITVNAEEAHDLKMWLR